MGRPSALRFLRTMRPAAPRAGGRGRGRECPAQAGARCGRPSSPAAAGAPARPCPLTPRLRAPVRARQSPPGSRRPAVRGVRPEAPRRRPPAAPTPPEPSRPSPGHPETGEAGQAPTPCPAGPRRRDAAPHGRTGLGRRDRKWRGGDSAALACGGREGQRRFKKKKLKAPKNLIWSPTRE